MRDSWLCENISFSLGLVLVLNAVLVSLVQLLFNLSVQYCILFYGSSTLQPC